MPTAPELIVRAYAALNRHDIDAALATMHVDVDWPGLEGGYVHGHDGVFDYWLWLWSLIDLHVDPLAFAPEAGRVVVRVHQVARDLQGNTLLDQRMDHIYTIEAGLIRRMDIRAGT